jgi:hypothetical protein
MFWSTERNASQAVSSDWMMAKIRIARAEQTRLTMNFSPSCFNQGLVLLKL